MGTAVKAPQFTVEDEQKPQFSVEDESPDISSEASMAAHPPAAAPSVQMHELDTPSLRLRHMASQRVGRPAGGGEEATLAEGAGPGGAALATVGTIGMPIEAIATRSLAPLMPLVRGAVGAYAGGHLGRYIGGRLGHPEAGETIGNLAGGTAGAMGVKVPHGPEGLIRRFLSGAETEAPAAATAAERVEPFRLSSPAAETEPAIQERLHFPETKPVAPPEEPFRLTSPPVATEPAVQGRLSFGRGETPITGRIAPVAAPKAQVSEPGRLQPIGKRVDDIVNQATGVKPLKADVPLREQLPAPAAEPAELDPIKAKYPDPEIRRYVRANGEGIVAAANGNPETLKAMHDLTRVDLRQALINAGEDMGQQTVSNSKFAGEGSIGREEAFNRLLKKGYGPDEIARLAKETAEGGRLEPMAPRYAYRTHDANAGPEEMDLERSHAHATLSPEEAESYRGSRNAGTPQKTSRINLAPLREGHDYELSEGPRGNKWVKFRTPRVRGDFE